MAISHMPLEQYLVCCTDYEIPQHVLGQNFLLVDLQNPPTVLFCKDKNSKIIFLFYPPTLNIICFLEKGNIFLRFCLCNFESDTVKSNCPVQIFREMMKY